MNTQLSTEEIQLITKKAKEGCKQSFEILITHFEKDTYNLATRIMGNPIEAEEILQEVFITVFKKLNNFQGKSKFSSWLYRITVNACLMRMRKQKQQKTIYIEEIEWVIEDTYYRKNLINYENSEKRLCRQELAAQLEKAIKELPVEFRTVFIMRDVKGYNNQEVSETLNISLAAVKSRLHRARLMIRKKMQLTWEDYKNPHKMIGATAKFVAKYQRAA